MPEVDKKESAEGELHRSKVSLMRSAGHRSTKPNDRVKGKPLKIVPVILAAGSAQRLGIPKALARFGRRTALEIAIANCRGLERPIVVLGDRAEEVRRAVPRGGRAVVNRRWREGMLGSLLTALRHVPADAALLLYPVDHPRIDRELVMRMVRAYARRRRGRLIVMPRRGKRTGHPVIFAPELRRELRAARTAREVSYRDRDRVIFVPVRTSAIFDDFDTPASYNRLARNWHARSEK